MSDYKSLDEILKNEAAKNFSSTKLTYKLSTALLTDNDSSYVDNFDLKHEFLTIKVKKQNYLGQVAIALHFGFAS